MALTKTDALRRVMRSFALMWLLTAVGLWLGTMLPASINMPISIITFILLVVMAFIKKVRVYNTLAYIIPILVGITLFWTTQFYIIQLGEQLVLTVFIGTIGLFALLGIVGWMLPDISPIGNYLFGALLVVIVFSLIFFFVPASNLVMLLFAMIVVLIFVLYTIYDFNQIRHEHIGKEDVVGHALGLYLDFINLFVRILEIIWRLKD